ncbi:MAG: Leucine-rich repeat (LRR) protein [Maribacter sp.]|jgi:Leucine-rich repeat (LRR) protein
MRMFLFVFFSLCLSTQILAQGEIADPLGPEEMDKQANFFLDNLNDANNPNENGEIRLFMYLTEDGEYRKEETWINPRNVYQLYVTSTPETATTFPLEILSFPHLQTLVFPLWKFEEVPSAISYFPNLEYLDLQGAPITTLPKELENLQYLQSINLSQTKVTKDEIENLREIMPKVTFFQ